MKNKRVAGSAARILSGFVFFLAACAPEMEGPAPATEWLPLQIDGVALRAQFALSPDEMSTGLMHRMELGENDGMLFVYTEPGRKSFWMKNTHLPLDLGFFTADGELREIRALRPYDLTPVPSRRDDVLLALEMNRGWFAARGIEPGAKLDLQALRKGLERRRADALLALFEGENNQVP
jgi:uncharacterized membrane protein (UPF0127 family)